MLRAFVGSCQALDEHPASQPVVHRRRELGPGEDEFDERGVPAAPVLRVHALDRVFSGSELDLCGMGTNSHGGGGSAAVVLVLGAATLVGSHIVEALLRAGYTVRVMLADCGDHAHILEKLVPTASRRLFIVSEPSPRDAMTSCDCVVIANDSDGWGRSPSTTSADAQLPQTPASVSVSHIRATYAHIRQFGKRIKRVIYLGPAASALPGATTIVQSPLPGEECMAAKIAACLEAHRLATTLAIPTVFLLPSVVIGPPQMPAAPEAVSTIVSLALGSRWFPFVPQISWSFIDARDVAAAVTVAIDAPHVDGQRFILSTAELSVSDVGRIIAANFSGLSPPTIALPNIVTLAIGAFRMIFAGDRVGLRFLWRRLGVSQPFDATKARKVLDLRFRPIESTIRDTVSAALEIAPDEARAKSQLARRDAQLLYLRRGIFYAGVAVVALLAVRNRDRIPAPGVLPIRR